MFMKKLKIIGMAILLIGSVTACQKIFPGLPPDETILDGPVPERTSE